MKNLKSTTLADRLLAHIRTTKETREQLNIVPTFTTRLQASLTLGKSRKEIEKIAKELECNGVIRIGETCNDKYYELIEQNDIEVPPRI